MADLYNGHGDLVTDQNPLTDFATENEHFLGLTSDSFGSRTFITTYPGHLKLARIGGEM